MKRKLMRHKNANHYVNSDNRTIQSCMFGQQVYDIHTNSTSTLLSVTPHPESKDFQFLSC